MALNVAHYFNQIGCFNDILNYQVSYNEIRTIREALKLDIDGFIINGLLSFSASINSLNNNNCSWAFIQSYYSIFFFARAFNGINDYAIVYNNKTPYAIKIQPLEKFSKMSGNSHDVVLNQFKNSLGNDVLLTSDIENLNPVEWFNKSRNFINYALNPQTDPISPMNLYSY